MRGEEVEQVELLASEADGLTLDQQLSPPAVDRDALELYEAVRVLIANAGSPEDGAHTRDDLARRERLRHVIVRSELQADDAIGLLPAGGQHDHGRRPRGPDQTEHLEAVDPREHQIEKHEVGVAFPKGR